MYSDEQIYECKEREEMPFLKNQNINMLFDIILEAEIIQGNDVNEIKRTLIDKMDKYIRKKSYQGKSLIQINKEFINSLLEPQKQEPNNEDRVIFTIEDIQADRMDSFQKNVERKKLEFQDAVNIKIPEPPKFSDDIDKPIKEIESLISKTIAERNFEIEKIHQSVNQKQAEQFLKGQETSLKNNKNIPPNIPPKNQNIKFIKIEKTDIKQEPLDVIELISESKEERNSIFSKLKMIPGSKEDDSLSSFDENIINQQNNLKNPASMDDIFYLSKKIDGLEEKIDRLLNSKK